MSSEPAQLSRTMCRGGRLWPPEGRTRLTIGSPGALGMTQLTTGPAASRAAACANGYAVPSPRAPTEGRPDTLWSTTGQTGTVCRQLIEGERCRDI